MKIQYVDASTVPTPAKAPNARRQQATEIVLSLRPGKVAAVTPGTMETVRGVKATISRAASREGRAVRVWHVGETVYAGLL